MLACLLGRRTDAGVAAAARRLLLSSLPLPFSLFHWSVHLCGAAMQSSPVDGGNKGVGEAGDERG